MTIKNKDQIALMREAGKLLWETHQVAREMVEPGVSTAQINQAVEDFIEGHNAEPLFKGVPGDITPFPAAVCASVNEQIVHGIPNDRPLEKGDLVSLDIGLRLNGWCADCACSHAVDEVDEEKAKLLKVTEDCLRIAIREMKPGVMWSTIARNMASHARHNGFSVVEELVGHGIGTEMWEEPAVPNYHTRGLPDFRLREGMVLAVEPMVNAGKRNIVRLSDHWTICTRDGKPSAHFEHDIAITAKGCRVLSCGPHGEGWAL